MTDKNSSESRRKLLKSIAAGSGAVIAGKSLPESWRRPVVDSVMLPAHAETSGVAIYSDTGLTTARVIDDQNSLLAEIGNSLIETAEAGEGGVAGASYYACATVLGSMADVTVSGLDSRSVPGGTVALIRRGRLSLPPPLGDGAIGTITAAGSDVSPCVSSDPTDLDRLTREAKINSINDEEIEIAVRTRCGESGGGMCAEAVVLIVKRSAGCLPEPTVYTGACPK